MKRLFAALLLLLPICARAEDRTTPLSRALADALYCKVAGNCTVGNFTITGTCTGCSGGVPSYPLFMPAGTTAAPTLATSADHTTGWHFTATAFVWGSGGTNNDLVCGQGCATVSGGTYGWSSSATDATAAADTTIARAGAKSINVGVGGDATGTVNAATLVGALTGNASTATTLVPSPTITNLLTLNSATQNAGRVLFNGQEFFAPANTDTNGPVMVLGINRTGNRRLMICDSANLTVNTTNACVRFSIASGNTASVEGVATDNITGVPLTITGNPLTIGAATLSGIVSGGGNQINNVIIGTSTPLAGAFTSLAAGSAKWNVDTNGKQTISNNLTLAGMGEPLILGVTSQKAETASADANVLTVTPTTASTYKVCVAISVASATSGVISWTLSWTDSNSNAQSNIAQQLFQMGTAAPNTTFTTSAAGNYHGCSVIDTGSTANIIVKWVGGGTTSAKMSAWVERVN